MLIPRVALIDLDLSAANELLEAWGHRLGPVNRPFRSEAWGLELHDRGIVSVAVSASTVSSTVDDGRYRREEVVELARLAASEPWANRVMLRLWREVCAPAWPCWKVKAAVSYSHNALHRGDLYRFDGWRPSRRRPGSGVGPRATSHARSSSTDSVSAESRSPARGSGCTRGRRTRGWRMPSSPLKRCRWHGYYRGHCEPCQRERLSARPSASARGYGSRWRAARAAFLGAHPICRCGRRAELVDHIVPHCGDEKLFWDESNWQALCRPCHDRKSAAMDGWLGHPKRGRGA